MPPRWVTSTVPPSGEYFAALSSRLLTARPSRSGTPSSAAGSSADRELDVRRVPAGPLHCLGDERVESHVVHLVGGLVAARELDQVGDQGGQLLRLVDHVVEQGAALGRCQVLLLEQQLGVGPQRGHGRAQLVRGVGDELALSGLGMLQPVDHDGEAVGGAAAEDRGERDAARAHQREHQAQAREHAVDALQRPSEQHRAAAAHRRGDDAHVLAGDVAVREPGARVAGGDRAVRVRDRHIGAGERPAVGVEQLDVRGRAALARGRRRQLPAAERNAAARRGPVEPRAHALDERPLPGQLVVDLRAQLAAHHEIARDRREHDDDRDHEGGREREPSAQPHHSSRST